MSTLQLCPFCEHETPQTVSEGPLGSGTRRCVTCEVCGGGQMTDSFPRPDRPEGVYSVEGCRIKFTHVIAPAPETVPLAFLEAFGDAS